MNIPQVNPEKNEVTGSIRTFGSFASRYGGEKIYFAARFSQPFSGYMVWTNNDPSVNQLIAKGDKLGADLSFAKPDKGLVVELRMGISYVSIENARANLDAEAGNVPFDE
ncbi:MAG: hypothetical protein WCK35_16905, partial [Chloroflexota bacterium]